MIQFLFLNFSVGFFLKGGGLEVKMQLFIAQIKKFQWQ